MNPAGRLRGNMPAKYQRTVVFANQIWWRKADCFMATKTEYLLSELRCASLRARLLQSNVDAVGLALKAGLISPDEAVEHLADCGVLPVVGLREEQEQAA
jgi:hypothetical protein